MRLLGIALSSFSSGAWTKTTSALTHRLVLAGLGELTFLQLSTTYTPPSIAAHCIGCVCSCFMKRSNVVDHHVLLSFHSHFPTFDFVTVTSLREQAEPGSPVHFSGGRSVGWAYA